MIAVMVAKWVGDSLNPEGIYIAWIGLHDYPFMPNSEFHDQGEVAQDVMVPISDLVTINGKSITLRVLSASVCHLSSFGINSADRHIRHICRGV